MSNPPTLTDVVISFCLEVGFCLRLFPTEDPGENMCLGSGASDFLQLYSYLLLCYSHHHLHFVKNYHPLMAKKMDSLDKNHLNCSIIAPSQMTYLLTRLSECPIFVWRGSLRNQLHQLPSKLTNIQQLFTSVLVFDFCQFMYNSYLYSIKRRKSNLNTRI